ncbi:hypothetical protein [Pseudarthrobacter sp. S6]|uniref:hypothetical protein n=1 Tax=Pseudarthrobacter sp. S6 TaxID=3418420 RepID=UPI003CE998D9
MAGQTTWNKATVPAGTDPWNGVPDWKKAIETSGLVFGVANVTERNGLAATAPGGVLPVPTMVYRADLATYETWDGTVWNTQQKYSNFITTDTNWIYGGGLVKTITSGKTFIQLTGIMFRQAGGAVTVNVGTDVSMGVYIPSGWRPTVPISSLAPVTTGTVHNGEPIVTVDTTGALILHATVSTVAIASGAHLSFNTGWYL